MSSFEDPHDNTGAAILEDEGESSLFYPSPPRPPSPSSQVSRIVGHAKRTLTLAPAMTKYMSTHGRAFTEVMARRIHLIKSRSQRFADCEVTVYDKVLLRLSDNGNDLKNPAAIAFFCEEHLNVRVNKFLDPKKVEAEIHKHITVGRKVAEAILGSSSSPTAPSSAVQSSSPPPQIVPTVGRGPSHYNSIITARLWKTYTTALKEYQSLLPHEPSTSFDDPTTVSIIKAARFLRDTAENAIQYLSDKDYDPRMMAELEDTLRIVKAAVVGLTGGKKRKFDDAEMEGVGGIPKEPAAEKRKPLWRSSGEGRPYWRRAGGDYWRPGDD